MSFDCPIKLGNLHAHLDPYTISWEFINQQGFNVPVNFTGSDSFSNDNRSLTIVLDDVTVSNEYRCVLQLRRCDIRRSGRIFRCNTQSYFGPRTRIFGKKIESTARTRFVAS